MRGAVARRVGVALLDGSTFVAFVDVDDGLCASAAAAIEMLRGDSHFAINDAPRPCVGRPAMSYLGASRPL
ncbi:MAG: hypothetical protein QOJ63_1741, partial [Solirubrobacteraceae bacterium]|nr:hypothetical protein [Solirubrobacteraceae bacterium]